jgi:3-isopropylmalate/(R)-2-methylmalate dehydratase small subunit
MNPVRVITGTAVPLGRSDVDTDQIIPSDWLKRVERTGFGVGLFSEWRDDPAFVMNDQRFAGARILLAGPNFGTGSSREHAVWSITDYGFEAVISPKFGPIFANNATKNGLVPVVLPATVVERLHAEVERDPGLDITVDVERLLVEVPALGIAEPFPMDASVQHRLLNGLDDIGLSLQHAGDIDAFEGTRPAWLPSA